MRPDNNPTARIKKMFTFEKLMEMGWRTIIPVIPPRVRLSPLSKVPEDQLGKTPGIMRNDGFWTGLPDWQNLTPTKAHAKVWDAMNASIGCRCDELIGLDCDIPDKELSIKVLNAVRALPFIPDDASFRVGRPPKWLLPVRFPGGHPGWNLKFAHPSVPTNFMFQALGRGRQFVLWGVHPGTGNMYRWSRPHGIDVFNTLPELDATQLEELRATVIRTVVDAGGELVTGSKGSASVVRPLEELKGDQELVTRALEMIPNDLEYDAWQTLCAAVRAASWDWPEAGLAAWLAFCERCTRVEPDLEDAERKWHSYRGDFRVGAQYVYDLAAGYGFNKALADFKPDPEALARAQESAAAGRDPDAVVWGQDVAPVLDMALSENAKYGEKALAARFIDANRERLIYVGERGLWHAWDGQRWRPDTTKSVHDRLLQDFLTRESFRAGTMPAETKEEIREKRTLLGKLQSATLHKNVMSLSRPLMTISAEFLDNQPWLLNTPDGLIDLTTGALVKAKRKYYLTKITAAPVGPAGVQPARWLRFLEEATQGDFELMLWLQRALGYSLCGDLSESTFFFLYGPGGNGKGVLLNTVYDLLGSYATIADRSVFISTRHSEHATVRASLAGARMILVPEVNDGASWNEAILKEFSAGDVIKARYIGQDEFEYRPEGTLWFSGNDRPTLRKVDPAIERRFRLVNFMYRPERPDPHLRRKLREEGPAIMRWLLDGCLAWQREGLGIAQAVQRSTNDYFAEHDPLRKWISERCTTGVGCRDSSTELYGDYQRFCREHVTDALSQRAFVQRLKEVLPGVRTRRSSDQRVLVGIQRRVRDASEDFAQFA